MEAQTFLENFVTIADARGGVERLRGVVLDLAVRGRLVRQELADEPVAALLRRVEAARAEAVAFACCALARAHCR